MKLAFTCSTTAGNHIREQVQQYMQQSFKDIGVEMTISNLPPAVMWGDYWMLSKFDSVIVGLDFLTGGSRYLRLLPLDVECFKRRLGPEYLAVRQQGRR